MRRLSWLLFPVVTSLACDDGFDPPPPPPEPFEVEFTLSPAEGGTHGGFVVELTADRPVFASVDVAEVAVQVGDLRLIELEKISDTTVRGISQGHPSPANDATAPFLVDATLSIEEQSATEAEAFRYTPPSDAVFRNIFAVGASFTAGIQSNSFNRTGQLASPVSALTEHIGAFFPTAFVAGDGIPPAPGFAELDPNSGLVNVGQAEVLPIILDAVNAGGGTLNTIRADPTLFPHNLGVPGTGARHILNGTDPSIVDDLGFFFIELLYQDPGANAISAAFSGAETAIRPPIVVLEESAPSMVLSTVDFFGNDVLGQADIPLDDIRSDLFDLLDRISKIDSAPPFFALSLLDVNVTPLTEFAQDERYELLAANQSMLDAADAANTALAAQGKPPRVFVGDFFSPFFQLLEADEGDPIDLAGLSGIVSRGPNGENDIIVIDADGDTQRVGLDLFEGIFSFDALHLTETGYAVLANSLIDLINSSIGPSASDARNRLLAANIAPLDIAAILARDPLAPKNLEAARVAFNQTALIPFPPLSQFADPAPLPLLEPWDRCAITVGDFAAEIDDACPDEINFTAPASVALGGVVNVSVQVRDQVGNVMPGLPVSFFIDNNSAATGEIDGESGVFTNAQGIASTTYTAGNTVGPVLLQAQAGGIIRTFTINVTP